MTKQITNLLETQGANIFSGGIPGNHFGGMYGVDAIARMADDEGLDTWISCRGNWVIESKYIEGSFILIERNGEIYLEAADSEIYLEATGDELYLEATGDEIYLEATDGDELNG